MEVMGLTENRYSGIQTMNRAMEEYGLSNPIFEDIRGTFVVTFYNKVKYTIEMQVEELSEKEKKLLVFLGMPRSRKEIADFLKVGTVDYAIQTYVRPLMEYGLVEYTIPNQPRSQKQKFFAPSYRNRGTMVIN